MSLDPSRVTGGSRPVSTIANEIEREIEAREKQIERIHTEVARLEAEIAQLRNARSAMGFPHDVPNGVSPSEPTDRGEKGSDADVIRQFARRAILEAGRPLNRGELLRMMSDAGLILSAKEPARRIGKVLWQSTDFISEADGYWLANRPLPST